MSGGSRPADQSGPCARLTELIPEECDLILSKDEGILGKHHGILVGYGVIPDKTYPIFGGNGVIPDNSYPILGGNGIIPDNSYPIPGGYGVISHKSDPILHENELIFWRNELIFFKDDFTKSRFRGERAASWTLSET